MVLVGGELVPASRKAWKCLWGDEEAERDNFRSCVLIRMLMCAGFYHWSFLFSANSMR